MRKDKGFEVADKIKLFVEGNEMLINIINKYSDVIKRETLTQEIAINEEADYAETVINGEKLNMTVKVIK